MREKFRGKKKKKKKLEGKKNLKQKIGGKKEEKIQRQNERWKKFWVKI